MAAVQYTFTHKQYIEQHNSLISTNKQFCPLNCDVSLFPAGGTRSHVSQRAANPVFLISADSMIVQVRLSALCWRHYKITFPCRMNFCNQRKVSVTPCTCEGIATLGRDTTVCFVRAKCSIYIQYVLGIWFRWSMCSQLRMNNSDNSDTVRNCKAKRQEVQNISSPFYKHQYWYFPWTTCQLSAFWLNPETGCCNTFDSSQCTCALSVAGERASVTWLQSHDWGKHLQQWRPQLLTSAWTVSGVATWLHEVVTSNLPANWRMAQ